MPFGKILLCHLSQFQTIINNHNGQMRSIFRKVNNFYVQIFLQCHMSNFNIWMTINDISMTSWVQLEWSCIVVENELF